MVLPIFIQNPLTPIQHTSKTTISLSTKFVIAGTKFTNLRGSSNLVFVTGMKKVSLIQDAILQLKILSLSLFKEGKAAWISFLK